MASGYSGGGRNHDDDGWGDGDDNGGDSGGYRAVSNGSRSGSQGQFGGGRGGGRGGGNPPRGGGGGGKAKKNPYVCFVMARKRQEEAKGRKLPQRLPELIPMFNDEWQAMDEQARAPYKAMAGKTSPPSDNFQPPPTRHHYDQPKPSTSSASTSNSWPRGAPPGRRVTAGEVLSREVQERRHQQSTMFDIAALVNLDDGKPAEHIFVIINFSIYCYTDDGVYIPGEVALTAFSIQRGVIDNYAALIDPGKIPNGYAADASEAIAQQDLPEPPYSHACRRYEIVLKGIEEFIQDYPTHKQRLTYLFCLRDEMERVEGCLAWLCEKSGVHRRFHLYPYSLLLQTLGNVGRRTFAEAKAKRMPPGSPPISLGDPAGIDNGRFMARRIPHTAAHEMANMKFRVADGSDYCSYSGLLCPRPPREFKAAAAAAEPNPNRPNGHGRKTRQIDPDFDDDDFGDDNDADGEDTTTTSISATSSKGLQLHLQRQAEQRAKELQNPPKPPPIPYEDSEMFMFEALAEEFLRSQDMAYFAELACPHHLINNEKVNRCALNIVNRYAFNSLDILVEYWNVQPIEGFHYPHKSSDVEIKKRRSLLGLRGIFGYTGLKGFEDSVDYSHGNNVDDGASSQSSSSYTEDKERRVRFWDDELSSTGSDSDDGGLGMAGQLKKGGRNSGSSNSLDNVSELETDTEPEVDPWAELRFESAAPPAAASSSANFGSQSRGQGLPRFYPGPGIGDYDESDDDDDFDDDDDDDFGDEIRPRVPGPTAQSETQQFGQAQSQQSTGRRSGPNSGSSDRPIPPPPGGLANAHFFDPLLRSYGRGVRAQPPEESPAEAHRRQAYLKSIQERQEKFYPTDDM